MSTTFPFLNLPRELRDQIYKYTSLSCGASITPSSHGIAISPCSLLLVCRTISEEYKTVLQSAAPVITAQVYDFDFNHVVHFLNNVLVGLKSPMTPATNATLKRPSTQRRLDVVMTLTGECRSNMYHLPDWLRFKDSHCRTYFTTTYSVQESSSIAPITLMRTIDDIFHNWYSQEPAGAYKEELGKVCDCLGEAETRINRQRTNTIPSGPRIGGLEIF